MPTGRTCSRTQLRLVPSPARAVFRVAKQARGPLSAPLRQPSEDATAWNRFDTIGRTVYLAQTAEIALAEVLASYKRPLGSSDRLAADATAIGLALEEFVRDVADEWGARNFMGLGCIPAIWRDERALYRVRLPASGWWVDIEHPHSIAAISTSLEDSLAHAGIPQLTTAVLRGEDRTVTTSVAEWLRAQNLDDGSQLLGVRFGSKHGGGAAWAYWMRRTDLGLEGESLTEVGTRALTVGMPALQNVSQRLGIRIY